ncbi:NSFL1 cofactor p47 [Sitodiplosis mosellana]|uniref:NSFL1 cofactor p47 n=1 Tax=Sitodiplosis mosellana TaxID=263140 RepID=UPI0024442606|nr:NSFL1 cofactor p47 [Sitodiplosis mosellana]
MSDGNRDEILSEFTAVTGVAEDRAKFYLESANWNLQLAMSSYYEGDQDPDVDDDDVESSSSSQPSQAPTALFGSSGDKSKSDAKNKSKNKYNASGARIVTLNNMASDDEEEDDGNRQAFYAGGSDSSGQQVLGPGRNKNSKDFVSNIFKSAKESGAEVVENPHPSRPSGSRNFSGTGYRLGQTNDDHVLLADTSSRSTENMDPIILRLWRQGFTINDSELRMYDDQKNREFLEYITKGELPPELRQQGNMVPVNMEDHRHEDYKISKIKPFSGKGHTLGSPTPNINDSSSTSIASAPQSAGKTEENEKLANENLNVDASQPTTSIQIRLADGSRLSGRFNLTHTINDLRAYVVNARPQYAAQTFALLTTFPSKELTDSEQTIEKAGLANAAIMQRLK